MNSSSLLTRLRERKIGQWAIAYLAGSWLVLQVLSLIAQPFAWPTLVLKAAVVLLGVGFLAVLVLAWYHGERGQQKVSGVELLILAALLVIAGVAVTILARPRDLPAVAAAQPAEGSPEPDPQSVAVLPFVNTSGDPQDEYFSDGMTDELALALARLPTIRVAGRTSAYSFKGKTLPASEIGRALNVGALVEGTVRRSGDRLRVTALLTSTKDGKVLWSDRFESASRDVFQVQDTFTRVIVAALAPALRGTQVANLAKENRGTSHPEAYDLYLKGKYFFARRIGDNMARAADYFREAIARDQRFARAYAGLAMTYDLMPVYRRVRPDSFYPLAFDAARRALALDSAIADAHLALGLYLVRYELKFAEAESHFQKALALEPSNPTAHQWYAINLSWMGRVDDAVAAAQRAARLDPLSATIANTLSRELTHQRSFPEAIAQGERALELDSTFTQAVYHGAQALLFNGAPDSAVHSMERVYDPQNTRADHVALLLLAYAAAGRWDDAKRIQADLQRSGDRNALVTAAVYTALVFGNRTEAMAALERAWTPKGNFIPTGPGEPCDPVLDPLRTEPRFRALMKRYGIQECPATAWPIKRPGR